MNHWIGAPILLPLGFAILLLLFGLGRPRAQRSLGLVCVSLQALLALALLAVAGGGEVLIYRLGDWPTPFGIVLVLDRLSALMLAVTAVIAWFSLWYATQGVDVQGRNFHALFQFQLAGLNGAFLTGDVFNLFVFFELLLIASYALLLHGGGGARLRSAVHYVVFNLVASALFLIAVAMLYANLGTLNMADMARALMVLPPERSTMVHAGALLLLVVFAAKAALVPLYFWLPSAYRAASAPVAALFSVMTKVGAYAIVRVYTLMFPPEAGPLGAIAEPWILGVALATLAAGTVGLFASRDVRTLTAYSVVTSVGMLLGGIGLFTMEGIRAGVYYLAQSTIVLAGLFLLADLIARQRPGVADQLRPGAVVGQRGLLGVLFLTGAVAVVGLPPLSGFVGKMLLLQAAANLEAVRWVWPVVLISSAVSLIAFTRAGSLLFWRGGTAQAPAAPLSARLWGPCAGLLAFAGLLIAGAGPALSYSEAIARQLLEPAAYVEAVLESANVLD